MKPWHLHTHDEKVAQFAKPCQWCGKVYVDHVAMWIHETLKCRKRRLPEANGRKGGRPKKQTEESGRNGNK